MTRILIVDDHLLFIDGLQSIFAKTAHHEVVGIAHDAKSAFDILEHKAVDIVLLNINLGKGDGISLCKMMPVSLKKLGLQHAIQDYINNINTANQISANCHFFGNQIHLPADTQLSIYRLVQESVNNAIIWSQLLWYCLSFCQYYEKWRYILPITAI